MSIAIEAKPATRAAAPPAWTLKRVVTAGVIGNVLEWYDFAIYGIFAPIFAAQFFPSEDRVATQLAAFATFAVGFLMRPVGAALFGHIGDRYGRARALLISVAFMAIPTVLMGFLPTYAQIGVAAPVLIVLMRMFQGMAVGGEFTSSIVFLAEHAPQRRRGFFSSLSMFSATSGNLLGALVGAAITSALTPEALAAWGWRAAFISGIVVAIVGVIIRRNMLDVPADAPKVSPLKLAFRDHTPELGRVFLLNMAPAVTYYFLFVYSASWLTDYTPLERPTSLNIMWLSILMFIIVVPIAASLSDRYGRKTMMMIGMISCIAFSYPLVAIMHGDSALPIAAAQLTFAAMLALYMAPIPAGMCEMFPHTVRVTAVSVGYGLAYAIFGGTAPYMSLWLIETTGNERAFVWYVIALTVISLTVAIATRDRRKEPLP